MRKFDCSLLRDLSFFLKNRREREQNENHGGLSRRDRCWPVVV